mgnify:FL=1
MKDSLVFSDLDGSLLRHDDYHFEEANYILKLLHDNHTPLILITSKTFAEVQLLQKKLSIKCPFIVENGAGIFIPSDSDIASEIQTEEAFVKISTAQSYLELRLFFKQLQQKYSIRGFGDMLVEEVMELTSLSQESALNAMKRDFTEPFVIQGDVDMKAFIKEVKQEGLDVVKGGRFYHLISQNQDKAIAMKHLTHLYEEYYLRKLKVIALGDSENDFTMLQAADVGILIPKYDGSYAEIADEKIIKAPFAGPKGWNRALKDIFHV